MKVYLGLVFEIKKTYYKIIAINHVSFSTIVVWRYFGGNIPRHKNAMSGSMNIDGFKYMFEKGYYKALTVKKHKRLKLFKDENKKLVNRTSP